ncbi:hypothetical protein [Allobaculum mucilyticum]|uniref:hypothetical protein n=1 Tax=Allobaculum mucilyticum TaxID=2834459 RepID=UPI001F61BD90|nr:hypothetical protein [Allobaculum mucilyticum]UNT96544.1 hypothetical protein KWG62_01930 [Allobaculum mucilyticum]
MFLINSSGAVGKIFDREINFKSFKFIQAQPFFTQITRKQSDSGIPGIQSKDCKATDERRRFLLCSTVGAAVNFHFNNVVRQVVDA